MIAFDLQCSNGHNFEGWFEDYTAYQGQLNKGLVLCPICSDSRISQIPSTFAIRSSQPPKATGPAESVADPEALKEISRRITEFVEKNFDDVGADFSQEALKIHYGVSEPRSIRGVSTEEEEKTLKAEGIDFFKIPVPVHRDPDV